MNVNNQQSTTFLEAQEKLIEFFLHSDIMPGMVLRESVLCKTFGVDRRSMREALCQAVGWGIAEYISFRGFRVRDFTLSDVYDWEEMRMALESAAASRLALSPEETNLKRLQQLIDDEREALINKDMENFAKKDLSFHLEILRSCGNKRINNPGMLCYITSTMRMVSYVIRLFLVGNNHSPHDPHPADGIIDPFSYDISVQRTHYSHEVILAAIRAGHPNAARMAVYDHLYPQVENHQRLKKYFLDENITMSQIIKKLRGNT